jgi:hypothetical protein
MMTGKKVKTIALLVCISLIFFSPVFPQLCKEARGMEKSCCCCCDNSSQPSEFVFGQKDDCGCQLKETPKTENQPAIFNLRQDTKPENSLWISVVEFISQGFFEQFGNIYSEHICFPIKGPPLYILNSSLLI